MNENDLKLFYDLIKIKEKIITYNIKHEKKEYSLNHVIGVSNNIPEWVKEGYDGYFLPKKIKNKIIKITSNHRPIIFSTNNLLLHFELWIYTDKKLNKNVINKYNKFAIDVYYRALLLKSFNSSNNEILRISYWDIDENKKFPNHNKILGVDEINSGATYLCNSFQKNGTIYIWRSEEVLKVMTHEIIHAFYYDKPLYHIKNIDLCIKENLHIKKHININESYVETYAVIIEIILQSKTYKDTLKMMNIEINHLINQVAKILIYNNFTNYEQLIYNKKELKQNTGMFSYYFGKLALLNNSNKFIRYYNIPLLNEAALSYCEFLLQALCNKSLILKINKKMNSINKKSIFNSSLKMTKQF